MDRVPLYSENNLISLYHTLAEKSGVEVYNHGVYKSINKPDSTWPKIIFDTHFNQESVEEEIYKIKSGICSGILPDIIMLSPCNNHSSIVSAFSNHATVHSKWFAMSIATTPDTSGYLIENNDFRLKDAKTIEDIHLWCAIVSKSLMNGHSLDYELFYELSKSDDFFFVLGMYRGTPIATCLLYNDNSSGGIYLISTLQEYRKKGIGTYITRYAIELAAKNNIKEIHLQATQAGCRVYENIGFKLQEEIQVFRL